MNFWLKWGGNVRKITSQLMYNLKKDKGAYISFGVAILITAIMLNLAFVLMFQVDRAYDKKFEDLDTATINIGIPYIQDIEILKDDIKGLDGVSEVGRREAVFLETIVKDFRGTDYSMNTIFYNKDEFRDMNKLDIKEERTELSGQPIYLPLYVASFGEFKLNDEIVYEIGNEKHIFLVSGVLEEMQYGNYGKGLMGAYLPQNVYKKFASEYKEHKIIEYSIIAKDNVNINTLNHEISNLLKEKGITMLICCDKDSTKDTRTMVCNLLILVLTVFAFVILLVSVFLCKFCISNSIEEDMIDMGVLKALGYTGNMIIGCVTLPYLIVTILVALLGVIVSYGVLPILSKMLTLQAGFSFELQFDRKSFFFVEIILIFIVAVFTYMAAKRIKKLQPINAIRGNGEEKEIKKNYFPLEETHGNTKLLLILKQILSNGKQNILLFGVSFILTILVALASTLFYNVMIKPNNFISTLSEEIPDMIIYPKGENKVELFSDLKRNSEVKMILKYMVGTANIDDVPITVFACEDFSRVSNDLCYKGKNPSKKNEVALGSAFEKEYELGEQIEIKNGDISRIYEITGFVQSVNYQGKICEFSIEGYSELNSETIVPTFYIYLKDGVDVEKFIEKIEKRDGNMIFNIVNYKKMIDTTQEIYSGITTIIITSVFILTILIVLIVLYIITKSLLIQRKQELGIYKAIGYSNWQLMIQLMGSFLPSSILAVLFSSILAFIYVPQMNWFIFQTIGAMKNNLEVSFLFLSISALLQILVYFIISISLTMPIKKISAYRLIKSS